jgi:chromosome partitioning protein
LNGEESLSTILRDTGVPRLSIAPSMLDLPGLEIEIAARGPLLPQAALDRRRDQAAWPPASFRLLLVDCPPSLNLLTMNAMAAAHGVLLPLNVSFALEGCRSC